MKFKLKKIERIVKKINDFDKNMQELSDEDLKAKTVEFKEKIEKGAKLEMLLPEAFAVAREAAFRVLGMKPYNVQLMGGIALFYGDIAEQKTGEGKTLTAVAPCYLIALAGVEIKRESVTNATITFQNLFNKYERKGGMTGTGITERKEFRDIYGMDVVQIPTNKPVIRKDKDDLIFKRKKDKYCAVLKDVLEAHEKGQPILIGTANIETSETLSRMLRKMKIRHNVLNAKEFEREADIVADAGQYGAVTIATNAL